MNKDVTHTKAERAPRRVAVKGQRPAKSDPPPHKKPRRDKPGELRREGAGAMIRERILAASPGFKSGDILTESQVARQLGLTLNPVRQALSQLANEGLVSILPRVGTQVRIVRPEEARAIMAMRFALETVIVGELARTRPDLAELRAIHEEMERIANQPSSPNPDDKYAFAKADMDFHAKMAELANGYSSAVRTIRDLTSQYFLYAYHAIPPSEAQATMKKVNDEHENIIKALEETTGDPTEPRMKLHEHIHASVERLAPFATSYLKNQVPTFFGSN